MPSQRFAPFLAAAVCGLLALGCGTTRQTRGVERSGFLGSYAHYGELREGERGEAQLVYIDPDVDWSRYDAIHLDSVTLWVDANTEDLSREERQRLTDRFYSALHEELSEDWKMVEHPAPGVLRIRAAITEAQGSRVLLDTVTSVVPQARAITTVYGIAASTALLVGRAGAELEVTDSLTGERLAAAVDRRQGTKAIRGGIKTWSDVDRAFDHWAERLRERLAELRAGSR